MKKVPVFDIEEDVSFDRGGGGTCDVERSEEVKAYPAFRSDLPLFGSAQIPLANDTVAQQYAIDESNGTGTGYDRMYLDLNGNQDLTDDAPLAVWVDPPKNAIPYRREENTVVCFEVFETVCDFGDEGKQPVSLDPQVIITRANGEKVTQGDLPFG